MIFKKGVSMKRIIKYFSVLLLGLSGSIGAVTDVSPLQQNLELLNKNLQNLTIAMNELP